MGGGRWICVFSMTVDGVVVLEQFIDGKACYGRVTELDGGDGRVIPQIKDDIKA